MKIVIRLFAFAVSGSALISNAHAQGDVTKGERLAQGICAHCHDVRPLGPFKQYPPSFSAIAVYRSAEDIRWKIIAPPLHTGMPQLGNRLTPDNIEHLIAYITSLENL